MPNWLKEILMKLYLMDKPVAARKGVDRRKGEKRWQGPGHDKPRPLRDPRRKRERRKKERRG
jgi:hypothetical protein